MLFTFSSIGLMDKILPHKTQKRVAALCATTLFWAAIYGGVKVVLGHQG
jgi:hypothetical protein